MASILSLESPPLPIPGVVLGEYPIRPESHRGRVAPIGGFALRGASHYRRLVKRARDFERGWRRLCDSDHENAVLAMRARLGSEGLVEAPIAQALGCASDAIRRTLGKRPYRSQLHAAAVLLDNRLAEMATGEGKTLAAALAAAVAALAGIPVHVITANDYLVERDADALEPFYALLGLSVATVASTTALADRRAAYACPVVYCTAREVAFDYLRDSLARSGAPNGLELRAERLAGLPAPATVLRGLCMAIIDEADSILIDEANMPLVLSQPVSDPRHRAASYQAIELARRLEAHRHFRLDPAQRVAELTDAGIDALESLAEGLAGEWRNRRHREDLVSVALAALHLYRRDHDYIVRDGRLEILDQVTGRVAYGRIWARGLHAMVELKEGCTLSTQTRTCAQITYQRFFQRYFRLCGTSGTLAESAREIRRVYRLAIAEVPLRRPSRRTLHPTRIFVDSERRWGAVTRRIRALCAQRRPILVGTDSIEDSRELSARLLASGIEHRVLDARHDRDEARIVAQAGEPGAVTVATNMAGRGTDIELGSGVAQAGGLHVLCCQDNPSRRLDRQLVGRCARQGDPGSAETWLALDTRRMVGSGTSIFLRFCRSTGEEGSLRLPAGIARWLHRQLQRMQERRSSARRLMLLAQDRQRERQLSVGENRS